VRTFVVHCHPSSDSFAGAIRDAVLEGLRAGGHEVRLADLHAEGFDPVLSAAEHAAHLGDFADRLTISPDIRPHAENLAWCESLVLVYPTWWAGQPAMLKGWIDRVWVKGLAWDLPAGSTRLQPGLRNIRRITVATSHGSSKAVNALEGEAGKRTVTRSLRALCARTCRTRWIALYGIDRATEQQRIAFLARVRRSLAR
jgi:NAD(P)H dehydrogenase (quinone)